MEITATLDDSIEEAAIEARPGVTHTVRADGNLGTLLYLSTGYTHTMSALMLENVVEPSVWLYPPDGRIEFIGVQSEHPDQLTVSPLGLRVLEQHVKSGASFPVAAEDGGRYAVRLVEYAPGAGGDAHFTVRLSWR